MIGVMIAGNDGTMLEAIDVTAITPDDLKGRAASSMKKCFTQTGHVDLAKLY
jgi:hypothetical protein